VAKPYFKENDMPLLNFGSILNFAEELETEDQAFYAAAAKNPACAEHKALFEQFAATGKKNVQTVLRTRRENVTEMILESIKDFTRAPFCEECQGVDSMTAAEVLETAKRLEERAERYYKQAAEKLKALSEVARALKTIGKKHTANLKKLADISSS
jgi:rubrerythrin